MFDIGFLELSVVAVIALFVLGPERLPEAVKSFVRVTTKLKRFMSDTKSEIEKQIGADDIRRELHNEEVMKSIEALKEAQQEALASVDADISSNPITDPTLGTDENVFTDPSLEHNHKKNHQQHKEDVQHEASSEHEQPAVKHEAPEVEVEVKTTGAFDKKSDATHSQTTKQHSSHPQPTLNTPSRPKSS